MKEGEEWFYDKFGKGETFDAEARTVHLWDMPALLLYINGLVDGVVLTGLLSQMQWNQVKEDGNEEVQEKSNIERFLSYFPYHSVTIVEDVDELLTSILSGLTAFITPEGYAFVVDARSYPRETT